MKRLLVSSSLLAKAMVGTYTRADGVTVKAHDSGRNAAAPNPAAGPKPGHMDVSSLAEGHHLFDKKGQKVDEVESVEKHPLGGLRVNTRAGYSHMVRKDGSNDHGLTNKAPGASKPASGARAATKKSAAKTGSAAPAKMSNIGTAKYPMHVKSSDKLGAKHADGSTHHVGGFEAPSSGKGDHAIHHDGRAFTFTGKAGKNLKSGEDSFEYSHHDEGKGEEHRAWVTRSGHLQND